MTMSLEKKETHEMAPIIALDFFVEIYFCCSMGGQDPTKCGLSQLINQKLEFEVDKTTGGYGEGTGGGRAIMMGIAIQESMWKFTISWLKTGLYRTRLYWSGLQC